MSQVDVPAWVPPLESCETRTSPLVPFLCRIRVRTKDQYGGAITMHRGDTQDISRTYVGWQQLAGHVEGSTVRTLEHDPAVILKAVDDEALRC